MLLSHFGATVFCEAWSLSLFFVDFIHCGLAQLPELCPIRAIQKVFPSAFQDVHAILPALSCAAEPASPGAYGQYSAKNRTALWCARLFLRSTSQQIPQVPRFHPLTFILGLSGSGTKCTVVCGLVVRCQRLSSTAVPETDIFACLKSNLIAIRERFVGMRAVLRIRRSLRLRSLW